ncbi:MAG: hypothetical protein KC422_01715 [Trueperaceae bacterium]|nr:hypothetical protein [Trueperaceae bacterium]
MQESLWSQLRFPFPPEALEWRIVELSQDSRQARVRPQVRTAAVTERLNQLLGQENWSQKFLPVEGRAIICELQIAETCKAAVASFKYDWQDAVSAAYDAFVYAAEAFGMLPGPAIDKLYWVDYDYENQTILYEPEITASAEFVPVEPLPVKQDKPEGQQAIDRLVDRLRQDGLGLEAAKLLVSYGGYGQNPEAARELYSKLRALLVQGVQA